MKSGAVLALALLVALPSACRKEAPPTVEPSPSPEPGPIKVLAFSKTAGFRHASIETAAALMQSLADQKGLAVDPTEDAAAFTDANLAGYKVVMFLLTTGDVLDPAQQAAFERYIRNGGAYVGVHSATDTEYQWPFYGELVGAYFKGHPPIQEAVVRVLDRRHPSTVDLPESWMRTDEWYNFRASPRGKVHVLAAVDETTYAGGEHGGDHPIAWCHLYRGGRAFYTAGGHTTESYLESRFVDHLIGGVLWAGGLKPGDCRPN